MELRVGRASGSPRGETVNSIGASRKLWPRASPRPSLRTVGTLGIDRTGRRSGLRAAGDAAGFPVRCTPGVGVRPLAQTPS